MTDLKILKKPFPIYEKGPFIYLKYEIKLNLKTLFLQNPCRSIKLFYKNELIFHCQHYRTKSTLDSEIHLEKKQFNMLFS